MNRQAWWGRRRDENQGKDAMPALRFVRRRVRVVQQAAVILVAIVSVAPLYAMIVTSLRPGVSFGGGDILPPSNPTLSNYATAWDDLRFSGMFRNSVILTLGSTVVSTLLATTAGFGLVRFRFRGKGILLAAIIGSMAISPIAVLIPLFLLIVALGWVNTYQSAILVEAGFLLPFAIFLMYSFMKDLPGDVFDAAAVDGAGPLRQFWHVAVPLSRPALITVGVISSIFAWNDLLIPLVMWQTDKLQTLMVGLATLGPGRTGVRAVPLLMAGVTISIVPLVVIFLATRRALIAGLTEGAAK